MSNVELRPLTGQTRLNGVVRTVRVKEMEQLLFKGQQIATISTRPGAVIKLLSGVYLSQSEQKEVEDAVAKARGGVRPEIKELTELPFEIIDDDEEPLEAQPKRHKK